MMITVNNKKAALAASLLAFTMVMPVYAIEFSEQNVTKQDAGMATITELQAQPIVAIQDAGMETVTELQAAPAPVYQPVDAEDQATTYLNKKGLNTGWNKDRKMFITVGTAFFDSEDPSYDDSFVIKRSLKSMEATLNAKAKIIEYINTNMSAEDKITIPGTDLHAEFHAKLVKMQKKRDKQKQIVAKLLDDVDQKQAEALRGATFGDRANAFMDAAIKKLDGEFSAADVESKKKEKFEKAKERYEESIANLESVEKEINTFKGTKSQESSSTVETHSKMPLFGAITTQQFESWNEEDEQYKVSLITIWSPKMEKLVRAMIKGDDFKTKPGKLALREWLNKQNWSTTTGGRRFRDDKGDAYFIGIAASAVGSSSATERRARGVAESFAKKEVAMSIFSDVESHKKAQMMMQSRHGGANEKETTQAAESFSAELKATIENRSISGLQKLMGKKVVHPISGQKIYVAVYGVSSKSARQALLMQESSYLTKVMDVKNQQKLQGIKAGLEATVKAAEADRSSYHQARAETLSNARSQTVNSNSSQPVRAQRVAVTKQPAVNSGSRAGVYQGAGDDDFDW